MHVCITSREIHWLVPNEFDSIDWFPQMNCNSVKYLKLLHFVFIFLFSIVHSEVSGMRYPSAGLVNSGIYWQAIKRRLIPTHIPPTSPIASLDWILTPLISPATVLSPVDRTNQSSGGGRFLGWRLNRLATNSFLHCLHGKWRKRTKGSMKWCLAQWGTQETEELDII